MVAAPRAVGVEVPWLHALVAQVAPCGAVGLDIAGRGDMVGGDRIPQQRENIGALDVTDHRQWPAYFFKERRVLDISGVCLPHIGRGLRHLDGLPLLVTGKYFGVFLVEHAGADLGHGIGDFFLAGPDIAQVHRLAIFAGAQRVTADIYSYSACQGISDNQRWRGQPVGFHQRVNAPFKVAVTGQDRGYGEVGLGNGFFNRLGQWPGVADTGGAAIAHQGKAQLVEVGRQAGGFVIVGDHLGAWCQGGLDPRLAGQAFLHGFFRHQACGHHHAGVGGVGARGDGSNHHRTIFQTVSLAFIAVVRFADQIRIAYGYTATAFTFKAAFIFFRGRFELQAEEVVECLPDIGQRNPVLRAFWPGQAGFYSAHVQGQGFAENWLLASDPPQSLGLAVSLHQFDRGFRAT